MEQRLSLITLGVADTAAANAFYEALGWKGQTPDGDVYFFQAGSMVVGLWGRDDLAADTVATDDGGWGGVTLAYNTRSRDEVDAVLAEAEAAGGTIGRPAAATEWGGYSGIFFDPDGHAWEVAHNPGWTITDDGATLLSDGGRHRRPGAAHRRPGHGRPASPATDADRRAGSGDEDGLAPEAALEQVAQHRAGLGQRPLGGRDGWSVPRRTPSSTSSSTRPGWPGAHGPGPPVDADHRAVVEQHLVRRAARRSSRRRSR